MAYGSRWNVVSCTIFVLLYQAVAAIVVVSQPASGASFWYPPIGIGMVGFLYFGPLAAILVFACDFLVTQIQYGSGYLVSLTIASSTTVECGIFYILHRMIASGLPVTDVRAYLKHLLAIVQATGAGALVGSGLLLLQDGGGGKPFIEQFGTWWVGDLSGSVAVVSVGLFVLSDHVRGFARTSDLTLKNAAFFAALLFAVGALVYLSFFDTGFLSRSSAESATAGRVNFGFGFLLIIPIVWIALHYQVALVAWAMLYISSLVSLALFAGAKDVLELGNVSQFEILNVQVMLFAITLLGISIAITVYNERTSRSAEILALEAAERSFSEREVALQARDEMSERLRGIIEGMGDSFFILDRDWRFTFANQRAGRAVGLAGSDLIGKSLWEVFPDLAGSEYERKYREAIETQHLVTFVAPYGATGRWFDVRVYPTKDDGLAVFSQEVTAQRQQQGQLLLLETVVANLNDIVLITEAEPLDSSKLKLIYVNDAFVRQTGYSREEAMGQSPRILYGPNTPRDELERIRVALANRQQVHAEMISYTKDGREFLRELDIIPIKDDNGICSHFVSVSRDVTERRKFEEHLRQSQKLEALGKLTGGVAHDFNNLLTVITGNSEILAQGLGEQHALSPVVAMIERAADRGAELTKHLLAFSRRQKLDPKVVDVNQSVSGMVSMLQRAVAEHVEIEILNDPAAGKALVDPGQLEGAILNLVINARDAMPDGGTVTIETANVDLDAGFTDQHEELAPGRYVMVSVSDTGGGIAPEILERVFEPFFTTKDVDKGTGLGLSMVYGFVTQSGGHVSIDSHPGKGTVVRLYLPYAQAQDVTEPVGRLVDEKPRGTERIFVVEDNQLVRDTVSAQLSHLGYEVVEASGGREALNILRGDPNFDLLFTDVVMPGDLNGPELADEVKQLMPDVRVLFTSGYADSELLSNSAWKSDSFRLNKPYGLADLATKIRAILDAP